MSGNKGGAPIGNSNAAKAKMWSAAINRALDARTRLEGKEALDTLAEELLKKCAEGDLSALKELGDRIDGKPAQSLNVGSEEENPLRLVTTVELVPLLGKDDEGQS